VLLLSRPAANEFLTHYLAVEVTTRVRGIPQELALGRREGLRERCVANFDNLRTVQRRELAAPIGAVSPRREAEIKRALGHALGWPELTLPV
jgi:mRNA-degrading endonuclease toxin of MazEF toxin-antitoxin module